MVPECSDQNVHLVGHFMGGNITKVNELGQCQCCFGNMYVPFMGVYGVPTAPTISMIPTTIHISPFAHSYLRPTQYSPGHLVHI